MVQERELACRIDTKVSMVYSGVAANLFRLGTDSLREAGGPLGPLLERLRSVRT